jgi:hypothetical protein
LSALSVSGQGGHFRTAIRPEENHSMNIWRCLALLALPFTGCNKVVTEVPLPPFSAFPNPFVQDFLLQLNPLIPASADVDIRVLTSDNHALVQLDNVVPGGVFSFRLAEEEAGIFYVEVTIDGEVFVEPILKAR